MSQETSPKYICQNVLPRKPIKLELVCITDGCHLPFIKDGGTYKGNVLAQPNSGSMRLLQCVTKRTPEGFPMYFAKEPVEPAYPGDPMCTPKGKRPSMIFLQSEEITKEMERLKGIRAGNLSTLEDEAVAMLKNRKEGAGTALAAQAKERKAEREKAAAEKAAAEKAAAEKKK